MSKLANKIKNIRLKIKYRWKEPFKKVEIPSQIDGNIQNAYLYCPVVEEKSPLIISLHSWAGNYTQIDPVLSKFAVKSGWHYIHPDFRGKNNSPQSVGSDYSMSDLNDAIQYVIEKGNVDLNNIFVVGGSGGAYAALCFYSSTKYKINSFIAWSPITDLVAWYNQSLIRESRYFQDIIDGTSSKDALNIEEAKKRSPLFRNFPITDSKLFVLSGYHDGYGEHPVPITHTLNFYNAYALAHGASEPLLISKDEMLLLTVKETLEINEKINGKKVYFRRKFKNIQAVIFDGGHDHIEEHSIELMRINLK